MSGTRKSEKYMHLLTKKCLSSGASVENMKTLQELTRNFILMVAQQFYGTCIKNIDIQLRALDRLDV